MQRAKLLVKGGVVVDGTGAPGYRADVRVREGAIAEIGADLEADGDGEEIIDATGAIVAPGFIDSHSHLDPHMWWDNSCDPNLQHGVTTALIGNCSLSLFPVKPETAAGVAAVFAYIEDVPLHAFEAHVPFSWRNYDEYRDAVHANGVSINLAALMGHTPLRLYVMGEDAWTRTATDDEIAQMVAVFDQAMHDGAWGLSTSFFDEDLLGRPVPSRLADDREFEALLDVIEKQGRGFVEFVPDLTGADPQAGMDRLAELCGPRGIAITWTGFTFTDLNPARTQHWIDLARSYHDRGIKVWPQLSPRTVDFRINWESSMMFMAFPRGWHQVIRATGREAKAALLADPQWRATARAEWDTVEKSMFPHLRMERVRFVELANADDAKWLGQSLADLVATRPGHPSDVFADFVLANDCAPGVVAVGISNADVDGVARTFADPMVIVSSSDSGAHVQMLCASGDATLYLTRHVRERGDFTLEHAVWQLTGRQAEIFGIFDRGVIEVGKAADLTVFALDELHWDDDEFVGDLPGGALRMRRPEGGYRATIVNGEIAQQGGIVTAARPGRMLDVHC